MNTRIARALAGLLGVLALTLSVAAPASAAVKHSAATNTWYCNPYKGNFGQLTVCIDATNNGYNARVDHASGPDYTVDFNLITSDGTYGDYGNFTLTAGQSKTYFFAVGYKVAAQVNLYWRVGSKGPYFDALGSPVAIMQN